MGLPQLVRQVLYSDTTQPYSSAQKGGSNCDQRICIAGTGRITDLSGGEAAIDGSDNDGGAKFEREGLGRLGKAFPRSR